MPRLQHRFWVLAFVLVFGMVSNANAYFSTLDTGRVIQPGQYRALLEPQIIFNRYDGFNLIGHFDTGVTEDQSVRGTLGFGEVGFQLGASYKWIPFPDAATQPAIGGIAGVSFARIDDKTAFSLRFAPLASKSFETEIGDLTPYASLPIGVTTYDGETLIPVQLAVGSEWKTLNFQNLKFMAELGLNLNEAFSYISAAITYEFND